MCCCIAPVTLLAMGVSSTIEVSVETRIFKIQVQAGTFAESILSSVRTIHSFDLRSRLVGHFDTFLQASRKLGNKKSSHFDCMFSAEYCIIYAGFGLCFWQGIGMIAGRVVENPGNVFMFV